MKTGFVLNCHDDVRRYHCKIVNILWGTKSRLEMILTMNIRCHFEGILADLKRIVYSITIFPSGARVDLITYRSEAYERWVFIYCLSQYTQVSHARSTLYLAATCVLVVGALQVVSAVHHRLCPDVPIEYVFSALRLPSGIARAHLSFH